MTSLRGARAVALEALVAIEQRSLPADETLDLAARRAGLDTRDRGLAVELVYGVLRRRSTLDWRLDRLADRPVQRLPLIVAAALRLGAYQLLYLDRIPPSAAVNESVALVKSVSRGGGRRWDGFTNAVLRSLLREPAPAWPALDQDAVAALAVRYACPDWLTRRWVDHFGAERAEALCQTTVAVPPLTLRVNTLRASRESLIEELRRGSLDTAATQVSPVGVTLEKCGSVSDLPQFQQGLFYIEDEAAQLVALLLDPQSGDRVLDACAAPGGKATHLASLMRNRGEIVALDRSPGRLQLLTENCRRLGVSIVKAQVADALDHRVLERLAAGRPFDRILLDAPCSSLGVLRRHPEGKWQKASADLLRHQERQGRLLAGVSRLLRPGGSLVYSTCSTEGEENEDVINHFLRQHAEFRREPAAAVLPPAARGLTTQEGDFSTRFNPFSMDGFFAARLRKEAA